LKRLIKKSNHVEPTIHNEVQDKVTNPDNLNENQRPAFLLAKELFAETTFIQAGTFNYEFAKKIENGEYEHISSIEDAKEHWEEWLQTLNDFLNQKDDSSSKVDVKKN